MVTLSEPSGRVPEIAEHELFAPSFFDDPYPTYAALREHGPLVRLAGTRSYLVIGFDEAYHVLRHHERYSSAGERVIAGERGDAAAPDRVRLVLITDDPPRHTRFRGLVNRAFTPRRVRDLEPFIRGVVERLVDAFPRGGADVDVVGALTVPLPVTVIATLLGIPPAEGDRFKRWSNALIAAQQGAARRAELMAMGLYLMGAVVQRRAEPAEDLLTALAEAEIDGERLQDWEITGFAVLLLVAGNETTTNLIGNMLNVLAGRPALWERLRADRSLVEPFIEETLRYDSPVQTLPRIALVEETLGGVTVSPGTQLHVCYGAANRDPRTFPEPDEFRLDRELSRHLAFGSGIHYCLGAPLARAEARIALEALLDRVTGVSRGAAPAERQRASHIVRGFQHLPLSFRV
ncbi:MAG: cytochrome P450 [Chloroflexi bacterium]|nr:cytochrome P450 [Chloroflexota bacterium]